MSRYKQRCKGILGDSKSGHGNIVLVRVRPGAPIISSTYNGISRPAHAHSCRLANTLANPARRGRSSEEGSSAPRQRHSTEIGRSTLSRGFVPVAKSLRNSPLSVPTGCCGDTLPSADSASDDRQRHHVARGCDLGLRACGVAPVRQLPRRHPTPLNAARHPAPPRLDRTATG